MEVQIALTGKDFVIIAADTNAARSIVRMKSDEDKIKELSPALLMSFSGEPGDTIQFAEFVERNLRLHHIRYHHPLRPQSAASWIRRSLAQSLRSRNPYAVNLLLGGYDISTKSPNLYWMDYLGTLAEVPFAAQGYGSYFVLSLFDRYHNPQAELPEALDTLKKAIDEVQKRLIIGLPSWKIKVVDKDGVREVELPQ